MMRGLQLFLLFTALKGLGQSALGSKIINGKISSENAMLYMASVQNSTGHLCGGFLISENFIVTAAHCNDGKPTSVVLGTHNIKDVDDSMRYSVKPCKNPAYENAKYGSDIMLLQLTKKVQLGKKIKKIQLPSSKTKIKPKAKCSVAGWGLTRTGGQTADKLQVVDVPILDIKVCKQKWANYLKPLHLPDNVICAGGYATKKGFCQGDSGGPLVCNGKAVGVVSFNLGKNCDYPNLPNVYTDVSKFLPWIAKILRKKKC
ncbi:mast cell protease 1A-like [Aulostomus maculatus]